MFVDIHMHSNHSDGRLSVNELVERAVILGLDAAVLTDHDTIDGCSEFVSLARRNNIKTTVGVELSCERKGKKIHILAYNFDLVKINILPFLKVRIDQVKETLLCLSKFGINIPLDAVWKNDSSREMRNTLSQYLVTNGYCESVTLAHKEYFAKGGKARIRKNAPDARYAIDTIKAANGVAVLAHPGRINMNEAELDEFVRELVDIGLDGIECVYPLHNNIEQLLYKGMCQKYGLLATVGTDFHRSHENDEYHGGGKMLGGEMGEVDLDRLGCR